MKQLLTLLLFISLNAGAQSHFQKVIGGNLGDNMVLAATPGGYYLLHNMSTPDFVTELLKFDLWGNYQWGRTYFFSFGAANSYRIRYENNSLFVSGGYQNNGYKNFLAKLDLSGNVNWIKQIDYIDVNINTRILGFNGGNLLVGHRDYIGSASDYTFDITLTQMDANGSLVWAKAYGDDTYDFIANAAVVTSNGEIMVAGNYGLRSLNQYSPMLARFDASGTLLWMKTFYDSTGFYTSFRPSDLIKTSDGNFVLTGYSNSTGADFDVHLIKFDGTGNILWSKRPYLAGANEYGKSVLEDSQHNLVVAGPYNFTGLYGDFLAKFDLNGNFSSAVKIEKTLDSPFMFNGVYNGLGEDLFEQPGFGYVYSTVFTTSNFTYKHCIITPDYNGLISCTSLSNAYPFSIQNDAWSLNNFTTLPSYLTNITSAPINIYDSAKTYQAYNLCQLVTSESEGIEAIHPLEVFPNPVSDLLIARWQNCKGNSNWEIVDETGRVIDSGIANGLNEFNQIEVDVSKLQKGIYFFKSIQSENIQTAKLIVR